MKAKGMILSVMMMLMCWSGAWARNMKGDVFLFEGDSLAQLNEDQCEVLDYALYLLEENDSVVLLPKEFNLMMGDTTDVKYVGHVDFKSAYFRNYGKSKENTFIRIPVYTETSYGVINSSFYVNKEDGKCTHYVCTQMPKNTIYKETSLFSNVNGDFMFGKFLKNGKYVKILGDKGYEELEKKRYLITIQKKFEKRRKYENNLPEVKNGSLVTVYKPDVVYMDLDRHQTMIRLSKYFLLDGKRTLR